MTAIVLQARLDSTRLPGKAMLPIEGRPVIFRVMEALNQIPADIRILACPDDSLSSFAPIAEEVGFIIFAGPKDDVLERYCRVIRQFSIDRVIRATGDNPFVFTDAAMAINAEGAALDADYAGYSGIPVGAGVESVLASALLRAGDEADLSYDREHVCPYLYTHSELFTLHRPLAPLRWKAPEIRLTIDTNEDYEKAKVLFSALNRLGMERYRGSEIIKQYTELFPK